MFIKSRILYKLDNSTHAIIRNLYTQSAYACALTQAYRVWDIYHVYLCKDKGIDIIVYVMCPAKRR